MLLNYGEVLYADHGQITHPVKMYAVVVDQCIQVLLLRDGKQLSVKIIVHFEHH